MSLSSSSNLFRLQPHGVFVHAESVKVALLLGGDGDVRCISFRPTRAAILGVGLIPVVGDMLRQRSCES